MRLGARLGIDVGRARIGVARSDPDGLLAIPVETVARSTDGDDDMRRIVAIAAEFEAIELVVGLPLSLSGAATPSTDDAIGFAQRLAEAGAAVRLVDERLSTVSAQQALRATGKSAGSSVPSSTRSQRLSFCSTPSTRNVPRGTRPGARRHRRRAFQPVTQLPQSATPRILRRPIGMPCSQARPRRSTPNRLRPRRPHRSRRMPITRR